MARQIPFPGFEKLKAKDFGGSLVKGNPREARPISLKRPIHLVMRSGLARGERSLLRRERQIRSLIQRTGRAQGVRIYRVANAGNHLHLIVLPRSRPAFHAFVRAITGLIARLMLGAEKGNASQIKFWDARPFTRILEWGKDYRQSCRYLIQNTLEALGFVPYRPRKKKPRGKGPPG